MNEQNSQHYIIPLIVKSLSEIKEIAQDVGLPAFQVIQIVNWIY